MPPTHSLDQEITQQEEIQRQSARGYQLYLTHKQEAQQLPAREQAQQQQASATEMARQKLQEVDSAYQAARTAFDQQELTRVQDNAGTVARRTGHTGSEDETSPESI